MCAVCTLTRSMSLAKSQCVIMGFGRMHKNKLKKNTVVSHTQVFVQRTLCNVHSREHTPSVLSPGWFWHRNTKPNDKSYQQRKLSLGSKVIDISGTLPRFSDRGSVCWKRRNEPPCSIAGCKTPRINNMRVNARLIYAPAHLSIVLRVRRWNLRLVLICRLMSSSEVSDVQMRMSRVSPLCFTSSQIIIFLE